MQPTRVRGPSRGLRANTGRMVETMPKPGRIAMYTSGCPKNQKRCCHSSGEPPECGWSRSLITRPAGMKKLVPARWSSRSRMQAGSNTANAIRPMTEVMNHAQVDMGMRASDMPLVRRSSVVAMKFNDPKSCPTQKIAIRSEEHTSELQSLAYLVCRLLLEQNNHGSHAR